MTSAPDNGDMLVAAGFVVFRRVTAGIEFLLLHASYEKDLWSPPKGHVDPGEEEKETAYRETREEAGFEATDLTVVEDFRKELRYEAKGRSKRVVYWLAELNDPNKPVQLSDEHIEFRWLPIEEAKSLARFTDMRETLDECFRYLHGTRT